MNVVGIWTLFKREMIRIKQVWKQAVFAPALTNLLFLLIFGVAIADRVATVGEYSYMAVLVPGLVAMGLIINALNNPLFSITISKYTNNIGDLLLLPLTGLELALAYLAGGIVRGFIVGGVTLIVGMFFVSVPFAHPWLILLFALLLGGTFASIGMMIGIVASDFDKANVVPTFVITPLVYLGGVFYSIDSLPPLFQTISRFNPIFYMVDGFRYGFLGAGDASLALSLGVTVVVFAIFFGAASYMFHTGYKLKS